MAGVDLYTVQRAGGWKTQVMVQRYAHLSPDHLKAAVERLAKPVPPGCNRHQNRHRGLVSDTRDGPEVGEITW